VKVNPEIIRVILTRTNAQNVVMKGCLDIRMWASRVVQPHDMRLPGLSQTLESAHIRVVSNLNPAHHDCLQTQSGLLPNLILKLSESSRLVVANLTEALARVVMKLEACICQGGRQPEPCVAGAD
jgi:hypothetical protein